MNNHPLILVGSISIDRIMNFGGRYRDLIQPDKLHVLSISILLDSLVHTRGGIAANIAYSLALLGDSATILASIGTDGQVYLDSMAKLGIDTSHIYVSDLPTSSFTVITDQDDNQVGGFYPGAMGDSASLSLKPWYNSDPLVVISAYDPATMKRLVQECRTRHLRLVYDPGQQVTNVPKADLVEGINAAELIIVNDYELGVLAVRCGLDEQAIKAKVPVLVTTLGAKGSIVDGSRVKKPIKVKAVSGIKVVDPTGAGDSYRAGFLYGYTRGWDLPTCAELASVTASYAVETKGTQEHRFTLADLQKRYYDTYGHEIRL